MSLAESKRSNSFPLPVKTGMKENGMVEVTAQAGDLNGKTVIVKTPMRYCPK